MSTTTVSPTTWDVDAVHSSVGFTVRHLVISKVNGRFTRWSGNLVLDEAHPEASRVEARIEAASIDTHEAQRDAHLRSADFLDSEKFPELVFRSTRVEPAGEQRHRVTGELTIHGVTRPVVLDVEGLGRVRDPWGGERTGFSAKTAIERGAFGLVWNQALEAGGVVVGDRIDIQIEIEAVKRA